MIPSARFFLSNMALVSLTCGSFFFSIFFDARSSRDKTILLLSAWGTCILLFGRDEKFQKKKNQKNFQKKKSKSFFRQTLKIIHPKLVVIFDVDSSIVSDENCFSVLRSDHTKRYQTVLLCDSD